MFWQPGDLPLLIDYNFLPAIPVITSILANHLSADKSMTAIEAKEKLEKDAWARHDNGIKCVWNGIKPGR